MLSSVQSRKNKMKPLILIIITALITADIYAQDGNRDINELVQQGIELHDAGDYEKAIETYKEALKIDKDSPFAIYELSLTYFTIGKYRDAEKTSKRILKEDNEFYMAAAIINGSSLDELGKPKKAIKVYEAALDFYPESYLLNYNTAVTYHRLGELDKAEQSVVRGLKSNFSHASSHFLLSEIMANKEQRIKTLLPLYMGLLIEPNTERSGDKLVQLEHVLFLGVSKKDEKNIEISLFGSLDESNEFGSAEMMLSLITAASAVTDTLNDSRTDQLTHISERLFSIIGEIKEEKTGFWWDYYVSLFTEMNEKKYTPSFIYYITHYSWPESEEWVVNNEAQINTMFQWLNE